MRPRVAVWLVILSVVIGCAGATSSIAPTASPIPTVAALEPTAPPHGTPTPKPPPTPTGTYHPGTVIGSIGMGPEGCLALWPSESSPTRPRPPARAFEFWLPDGYRVTVENNNYEVGGPFRVIDPNGAFFADENDVVEAVGKIPTSWGSFCMFGQPLRATAVVFVESRP